MSVYKKIKYINIFGAVLFLFTVITVVILEYLSLNNISSFFFKEIMVPIWVLFFLIAYYLSRCPLCETFQVSIFSIRKNCWHCSCDLTKDHNASI